VFEMCRRIVEASPMLRSEAKITANRITFTATGATITAVASDYAGAAGGHPTISVFDELWGYTSERSRRLWDELVPVPTRKVSCRLVVSYAGFEGESELLYELYKRGMAQPLVGKDLHAGDGMLMFWTHEPVAPWQTPAWLAEMRRSLRPNQYLRMIENEFVTTESTFIDMDWWDACTDPALTPVITDSSLPIWVGVDASTKHDSTAIVAVTWDETNQKVRLVASKTFQPSPDAPLDFEMAIEHTLLALHQRFDLRQVLYDPFQMQSSARRLQKERIEIEEFPQTVANLTEASQNLYELIKGRNLVTYPDDAMRLAISRAVAIETSRGWRIAKEKQAHRIDVVVALAMAALCCVKAQSDGDYDITFRWVSEDPPPDDSKAREERVRNLIELLKTGAKVPF
jgi:phage terminase large subunit-like protein